MIQSLERIALRDDFDVVLARQRAREISRNLGFSLTDQTRIATAVSEVARRAVANHGSFSLEVISDGARRGIECTCYGCDPLPATPAPFEVAGSLRGVERLMDEFIWHDTSERVVIMRKWLRGNA